MKRTRNMVYKQTAESKELVLCIENNGQLSDWIAQVLASIHKHLAKGNYQHDRAVDAFYRVATEGSNLYYREFGYRFTVQERFTAAVDMVYDYIECEFGM